MRDIAVMCWLLVLPGFALAQSVTVGGLAAHPGPVALAALPQETVNGAFNSMHGRQSHVWAGPLLLAVLKQAGVKDEPGERTHMRHVILAHGTDGYAAAIAIGEIEPGGEGKKVIVALTEDGKPMKLPRLVVPGDASLTRSVHDLATLEIR